jgi:hypothetical protein
MNHDSPSAFIGGVAGAHITLEGLAPGAPGYVAAMLRSTPILATELVPMYDTVLLHPIAVPVAAVRSHLQQRTQRDRYTVLGEPDAWVDRQIVGLERYASELEVHVTTLDAVVPQANAVYRHLARLDAMQAMLGVNALPPFVAALRATLLALHAETEVVTAAGPTLRTVASETIAANRRMVEAYGAYQRAVVSVAPTVPEHDQPLLRELAQACHRAMALLVDTPFALAASPAGSPFVAAATVSEVRGLAEQLGGLVRKSDSGGASAAAAVAAMWVAVRTWSSSATELQHAIHERRAAAEAMGRAVDADRRREEATTAFVVAAQVREALSLARAVRDAVPDAVTLATWRDDAWELIAAPPPAGVPALAVTTEERETVEHLVASVAMLEAAYAAAEDLAPAADAASYALGPW